MCASARMKRGRTEASDFAGKSILVSQLPQVTYLTPSSVHSSPT